MAQGYCKNTILGLIKTKEFIKMNSFIYNLNSFFLYNTKTTLLYLSKFKNYFTLFLVNNPVNLYIQSAFINNNRLVEKNTVLIPK